MTFIKGYKQTLEQIEKLRATRLGRKLSNEWKKKIGDGVRGFKHTEEAKRKIAKGKMGDKNPMKRPDVRKKVSEALKGRIAWNKNIPMKQELKDKLSLERKGKTSNTGRTHFKKGNVPHNYMGGISFEPYGLEFNRGLKEKIRKRDNYTCQISGKTENELGQKLSVHHIDYNKKNNKEGNLISLSKSWNAKVNSNREDWINYFKERFT